MTTDQSQGPRRDPAPDPCSTDSCPLGATHRENGRGGYIIIICTTPADDNNEAIIPPHYHSNTNDEVDYPAWK